ncbi:MAG: FKBP-type peptidyl-prolyl cis-trans isomerase [Planctomycetota bacterium]|jgi:FKBP-type peptidyl-prolyl cis-trans isomerase
MGRLLLITLACVAAGLAGCDAPEVKVSAKPIEILSETPGRGRAASPGDVVSIDYRISLPDGAKLLEARDYRFQLGRGAVIEAIDEAVLGMRVGGRRRVLAPPHMHWGREGHGDGAVPRNVNLTIAVTLKNVD